MSVLLMGVDPTATRQLGDRVSERFDTDCVVASNPAGIADHLAEHPGRFRAAALSRRAAGAALPSLLGYLRDHGVPVVLVDDARRGPVTGAVASADVQVVAANGRGDSRTVAAIGDLLTSSGIRVCVAAGTAEARAALSAPLRRLRYRLLEASTARRTLELVESAADLRVVVCECSGPAERSLAHLAALQQLTTVRELAIVAVTDGTPAAADLLAAEVDDVVTWHAVPSELAPRLAAALARRERQRAWRAQATQARSLFDTAPDLCALVSLTSGRIIDCNDTFVQRMGYSRDELFAKPWQELYHPDEVRAVQLSLRNLLREGRVDGIDRRLICKDGNVLRTSVSATRVDDEQGRPTAANTVWRDVAKVRDETEVTWAINRKLVELIDHFERELISAKRMHAALLPRQVLQTTGVRFNWMLSSCDDVGGDILNVFPLDGGRTAVYVLDVSGHGLPAALYSGALSRVIASFASVGRSFTPCSLLQHLNRQFPLSEATEQYFTIVCGIVDVPRRQFRFVSAGHPGPILLPANGSARYIPNQSFPVGFSREPQYQELVVDLQPRDRVFLYTDGLVETLSPAGEQLGIQRILDTIERSRALPLRDATEPIFNAADGWSGGSRAADDRTALAFELG